MTHSAPRHHHHSSYYAPAPHKTLPITMPSKSQAGGGYYPVSRVAVSPPDLSDASTVSGSRGASREAPSSYSANSSSYAPSFSNDYESCSAGGVDVVDMLSDRMNSAFEPMRLDRSLATQAKTSGQLNAKQRELLELQAQAQRRLKGARKNFSEGMKAAKETKRDIEWTQKKVS
ncbi:MAG: hypothetical protein Q9227_007606 [Pyrenula ochraceoflavens]